ncbi:MAG TPA: TraR/DksA C4-type zinc finger protein [Kiritimatiellia bacterium]|nr:TraR/DksA C4-type zinc finger protein [Kiritimatiellia bacterium]HRU71652.1 TraR/DksA C4-type zinc finger protein [Kiritimatiellia bacterium]
MTVAKKSKPKATPTRKPVAKKSKKSGSRTQKPSTAKKSAPAKTKAKAKKSSTSTVKSVVKSQAKHPVNKTKKTARPVPKAALPAKKSDKKIVTSTPAPVPSTGTPKTPSRPTTAGASPKHHFSKSDLAQFKAELLAMRERITGQSGSMRNAALQRNDEVNPEEDGTDAFMRLQTLEQVGSQHRDIANIDDALRSIEKGTYGICEMCGELISKPRLAVLPFATNCIKCQSEMERMSRRGGRR